MITVPTQLRVAAILLWFAAFGFGVFCFPAIGNLLSGRDVPHVLGYPAYGQRSFERAAIPTTVHLLVAFVLVCILERVAGLLLWDGYKTAAILPLMLVSAEAILWWGFALSIPPLFALVRTMLIVLSWQSLG